MGEIDEDGAERVPGEGTADIGLFAGGFAIGVLLVGVLWGAVALVTGSDEPASGQAGDTQVGVPLGAPSATRPAGPSRMDRCVEAEGVLAGPLREARPALDQWAVHVGAMNKLVVGEITLAQATAFWNQTRVGAYHRIKAFDHAMAPVARKGVDCPAPRLLGTRAPAELRTCSTHVAAEARTLDAAQAAVDTWRHHVTAMDQLRRGKLAPAAATQMWLSMWQRGVQQIDAYRVAAQDVQRGPACDGLAGGPTQQAQTPSATPSAMPSMDSME